MLYLESSREYGRQLILGITKYTYFHSSWTFYREPGGRERRIPNLKDLDADGIIAHVKNKATADRIIESGIPAVTKGFLYPGLNIIHADNAMISEIAARHLMARGFKNFAFYGYTNLSWSTERLDAFVSFVSQKGKTCFPFTQPRSKSYDKKQDQLVKWIKSLPKPIGVMTSVDDQSQEILQACKAAGIDVPTEVAIVGVDNDPLVCRLTRPQLSSVALDAENAGYEAAELLDRLMNGEKIPKKQITTKATHVEVRQSTDILAMEDRRVALAIHYIKQNLNKIITVDDIVNVTLVPRRTLQMSFKKEIGRSIAEEIRRLKCDQLAQMLITTDMPISKIALDLGYPGIDHISRSFRKEKGMSPIEYRQRYTRK